VLEHVESVFGRDFNLHVFNRILFEFYNFAALDANHVVMVLPEMPVFIAYDAVVEFVFPRETEITHKLERISHELAVEIMPFFIEHLSQFGGGDMILGLKKGFEHLEPVFEIIDISSPEKLFELFFFLKMSPFHTSSLLKLFAIIMPEGIVVNKPDSLCFVV
jgi:hypothetical protein